MWEVRPISTNRSGSVLYVRLLRRWTPEEWEAEQRRRVAALLAEFGAENLPPEWEAHADWRALIAALAAAGIPVPPFDSQAPVGLRIAWSVTTGGQFNVPPEDRWHEGASAAVYELPVETRNFSAKAACYEGWPWDVECAALSIAMASAALGLDE
jgi:hypothetical protein